MTYEDAAALLEDLVSVIVGLRRGTGLIPNTLVQALGMIGELRRGPVSDDLGAELLTQVHGIGQAMLVEIGSRIDTCREKLDAALPTTGYC